MSDTDFPREPRDDAEREACEYFSAARGGDDYCKALDKDGFCCTRRPGHAPPHVCASWESKVGVTVLARWPAAPEASTPEPAGTQHSCATCERVQCPDCMAPATVAAPAPEVRALVDATTCLLAYLDLFCVSHCHSHPECTDRDDPLRRENWCQWCTAVGDVRDALAAACGSTTPGGEG